MNLDRMDALAKLFQTGVRIGVPNATMRSLFTKTRKGRSARTSPHAALPMASTRRAPKVATEEEKAEAREKAKKKREEEAARKRAAAVETKRKANAKKSKKVEEEAAVAANRKPFEAIKNVPSKKNIVVKYIPEGKNIPEGFKLVGHIRKGVGRYEKNMGPEYNNLAVKFGAMSGKNCK